MGLFVPRHSSECTYKMLGRAVLLLSLTSIVLYFHQGNIPYFSSHRTIAWCIVLTIAFFILLDHHLHPRIHQCPLNMKLPFCLSLLLQNCSSFLSILLFKWCYTSGNKERNGRGIFASRWIFDPFLLEI